MLSKCCNELMDGRGDCGNCGYREDELYKIEVKMTHPVLRTENRTNIYYTGDKAEAESIYRKMGTVLSPYNLLSA